MRTKKQNKGNKMKLKTTKKQIKNQAHKLYSVGYCSIQHLLRYESPFAYSAGSYGWSCDYYNVNGVILSTGYSSIGEPVSYDLIKEYENASRQTQDRETVKVLLNQFISKIGAK